ncbi:MAG: M23 family metallopeptidase [Syntrophales bacterium]
MNNVTAGRIKFVLLLILIILSSGLLIFQSNDPNATIIKQDRGRAEKTAADKPKIHVITGSISTRSSLYLSLADEKVPRKLIADITSALNKVFDLKCSSPGDTYLLKYCLPDILIDFEYIPPGRDKYVINPEEDSLEVLKVQRDLERSICFVKGRVKTSLWETMVEMGEEPSLILNLTDIFAWDIDFLTDVREGDEFELLVECFQENGHFVFFGDILAARYSLQGEEHYAILYQNPEGHRDYYDLKGKSLRKTLLKSPLNYRRISSKFSLSRLHPILKIRRPHYGVDYAARTGTPVVAAGEGRIIYKGWKGGYGKTVIIKHALKYRTSYGHLSRFAKKLSKGSLVKQGQVIGYVGSTGLATGPHLDYRVKKSGRYIDPLTMVIPSAAPIQQKFRQDYCQVRDKILLTMQSMAGNEVARSKKD